MKKFLHLALAAILCSPLLVAFGLQASAQAAAPAPGVTAQQVMTEAEQQASAGHKSILLTFGASWCGNCRLFDKFLADPAIHPIMQRAFVFADLTTGEHAGDTRHSNTPGGQEVEASLGGKEAGWPYIVMLDAEGKRLADSVRPGQRNGNIGYPDSPEEIRWFMDMLAKSAPTLTAQDTATIQSWLTSHSTHH